jgi:DNA-binding transcriptional LysR family regulator
MELHQVRYFLALARSLNFTRAAEQCNVTQPALTKAVQRLEQELGGALIYRERELTQLTDLGKLILPMVERTLSAADAVRLHALEFQRMGIAPLKIGLAPCISVTLVIQPLIEIARIIPGLQVELIEVAAERLPALLLEGDVNVALAGNIEGLPERIDHWLLFEERFVVLTADDNPLARLRQIPIDALAEAAWVERIGCELAKRFWQAHFPRGEEPKISYRGQQESHLQHMVAAGLGVMLAPEHAPHLPALVARRIVGDPLHREVQLLVVAGRRYSPALDAFVKIARLRDWRGNLNDAHPAFSEMDRETRGLPRPSCRGRPAHVEVSRCA